MSHTKEAEKVTWIGFLVNLLLTTLKIIAGILGNSAAMIADGIHSLSDFLSDIIVITMVRISGKEKDKNHPYGHGKYETFATLIIAILLAIAGIGIFISGTQNIINVIEGEKLDSPGIIALIAAIISILFKEILFRYTIIVGRKINNKAVIANAWHHRSDAFSSIGTALGISGAIFLGENWRILDPIASMLVSIFIIKVSIELALPSIKELLETSLPAEVENQIITIINNNPDIKKFQHLCTRKIGSICAIDVHIKLDKDISFIKSHDIATDLEHDLCSYLGENTEINIHTEPYLE